METAWFLYTNPNLDPVDPSSYKKLFAEPTCNAGVHLCAIEALVLPGDLPDLTTPGLPGNMVRALQSAENRTNPGVKLTGI